MDEPKFDAYSLPELGAHINVPKDEYFLNYFASC